MNTVSYKFPARQNLRANGKSMLADGYLIDLDGTLVSMGHPLPGAADLLAMLESRFVVVSNNAEHTPAEIGTNLRMIGMEVPENRIVLAGCTALETIAKEQKGATVLIIGSNSLRRYARTIDLRTDIGPKDTPDIVFIGRDRRFSYKKLSLAANAVLKGAQLIAANPDLVHPGIQGSIVPETGALLKAVLACTGPVPVRITGKPEPTLFLAGLDRLGISAGQAVMIGDNFSTDGKGALSLGMRYLKTNGSDLSDIVTAISQTNQDDHDRQTGTAR